MFSVRQKREISDNVQKVLRETSHPELGKNEITFLLIVHGKENWSYAEIRNNGSIKTPSINPHNEAMDYSLKEDKHLNKYDGTKNRKEKLDNILVRIDLDTDEKILEFIRHPNWRYRLLSVRGIGRYSADLFENRYKHLINKEDK